MTRQRLDWVRFFGQVPQPHGIRIRLAGLDSTAPEGLRTEKRLIRLIKARSGDEPFALRRSYTSQPPLIDCVFRAASLADDLAKEIGAVPVPPPFGWATARELVADGQSVRRILKIGGEACLPRVTNDVPVRQVVAALAIDAVLQAPRDESRKADADGISGDSTSPVGEALRRLAKMSRDEQAAAVFQSMKERLGEG